jgi:hypothetical protein
MAATLAIVLFTPVLTPEPFIAIVLLRNTVLVDMFQIAPCADPTITVSITRVFTAAMRMPL